MHGTIQTIRAERGFGFIRNGIGDEIFFHRSALTHPAIFCRVGAAPPREGWSLARGAPSAG
jgi:hypothetical protein